MKHTPAPWTYDKSGYIRTADKQTYIAEVLSGPDSPEVDEGHANARLMVSAPELLEAAEALLAKIDSMTSDQFSRGEERPEREALRAAIAKAKG